MKYIILLIMLMPNFCSADQSFTTIDIEVVDTKISTVIKQVNETCNEKIDKESIKNLDVKVTWDLKELPCDAAIRFVRAVDLDFENT